MNLELKRTRLSEVGQHEVKYLRSDVLVKIPVFGPCKDKYFLPSKPRVEILAHRAVIENRLVDFKSILQF